MAIKARGGVKPSTASASKGPKRASHVTKESKPKVDYSEEFDLIEPTEEELEGLITTALEQEREENLPSVDLTLVHMQHAACMHRESAETPTLTTQTVCE